MKKFLIVIMTLCFVSLNAYTRDLTKVPEALVGVKNSFMAVFSGFGGAGKSLQALEVAAKGDKTALYAIRALEVLSKELAAAGAITTPSKYIRRVPVQQLLNEITTGKAAQARVEEAIRVNKIGTVANTRQAQLKIIEQVTKGVVSGSKRAELPAIDLKLREGFLKTPMPTTSAMDRGIISATTRNTRTQKQLYQLGDLNTSLAQKTQALEAAKLANRPEEVAKLEAEIAGLTAKITTSTEATSNLVATGTMQALRVNTYTELATVIGRQEGICTSNCVNLLKPALERRAALDLSLPRNDPKVQEAVYDLMEGLSANLIAWTSEGSSLANTTNVFANMLLVRPTTLNTLMINGSGAPAGMRYWMTRIMRQEAKGLKPVQEKAVGACKR